MIPSILGMFENFLLSVVFLGTQQYHPTINDATALRQHLLRDFELYCADTMTPVPQWSDEDYKKITTLLNAAMRFMMLKDTKVFGRELLPTELNAFVNFIEKDQTASMTVVDRLVTKLARPKFNKKAELARFIKRAHTRYHALANKPAPQGKQLSFQLSMQH
jgi:hypothetical protein